MHRATAALGLVAVIAIGCTHSVPRERVTFAVLAGVYYSTVPGVEVEGALVEEAETLLRRTVADLNAREDLDFVVVAGDLLARSDPPSIDRAKAILAELRVPYYAVLGEHDGPGKPAAPPPAGGAPLNGKAAGVPEGASRSTVVWAFQGHGFSGPEGYWSQEVMPGLALVGLDTVQPGRRGGHVDAQQVAWLDRTLKERARQAVIVVGHHGLVPLHPLDEGTAWQHMMADNATQVRSLLASHANVMVVISGHHHLAGGKVSGQTVYLSAPSVSVWPLAYHLVQVTRNEAEAVWVPVGTDALSLRAQERLLGSKAYRGVFPPGEDGDTACVRLFGGEKMKVYPLPAIRP